MPSTPINLLKEKLLEISHLVSVISLLNWDREVYMPEKGAASRSVSIARMSGIVHNKIIALDENGLLSGLKKQLDKGRDKKWSRSGKKKSRGKNATLVGDDATIVYETWRSFERERKLPEHFVREVAEVTSTAQHVWAKARAADDFKPFLPWLTKIVTLKKKEAELVGYSDSPYDALIDAYEPGMTAKETSRILNDMKDFLVPFLKKILAAQATTKIKTTEKSQTKPQTKTVPNPALLKGDFPLPEQIAFNEMLAQKMGFDLDAGRIDQSTHPFTTSFHPGDVRITTRYDRHDIFYSIGSTIHEAGHALYEQGLPAEHFGTPLAESVSLGIHESQSRLWENNIGKSKPFWHYFYPKLQKQFPKPFKKIPLDDFYRIINHIKPSLIRTQADEVTYNLHIIIRFEIERGLIEGSINSADLPRIWRSKMKEYLGIDVPTDREGVLQDVHWSAGLIGYFPTYSFGNLYAAQLYATMLKIPHLEQKISRGNLSEIREWLRKHIHMHGKSYSARDLIKKVTGEPLNSTYFRDYIEKKFGKICRLEL